MERFNLNEWLKNKDRKVIDDDGFPVTILAWNGNEKYPVIYMSHKGVAFNVTVDGMYDADPNHGIFFADAELNKFEKELDEIVTAFSDAHAHMDSIEIHHYAKKLLEIAREELRPEFDEEIEHAYKTRDNVVYAEGYEKGKSDAKKISPNPDLTYFKNELSAYIEDVKNGDDDIESVDYWTDRLYYIAKDDIISKMKKFLNI